MSVIKEAITQSIRGSYNILWETLTNGDTGRPLLCPHFADKSVQVTGTFGSGGTVILEGSNDGTNWETLNDPQGTAISLTVAGMYQVLENTKMVRPSVTAGDGATDLDVTMIVSTTARR